MAAFSPDIAGWLGSLDEMLSYSANCLLSEHTRPLCGKEKVRRGLTGAVCHPVRPGKTLAGMNKGKDMDTSDSEIVLPQEYASLSYLGE